MSRTSGVEKTAEEEEASIEEDASHVADIVGDSEARAEEAMVEDVGLIRRQSPRLSLKRPSLDSPEW